MLDDKNMIARIQSYPGVAADLVAMDVQYHRPCMNTYLNTRIKAAVPSDEPNEKNDAFATLMREYQDMIFHHKSVVYLSGIRDRYRALLAEKGVENANTFRSSSLKKKLQAHFGDCLTFWPQPKGIEHNNS